MSAPLDIPSPPGYRSLVPFDKSVHRNLGVAAHAAQFATKMHAIYLTEAEIPRAALDYPVVFARDVSQQIVPIALVGVEAEKNLICDSKGHWPVGTYVPAYVRRYPFFMARLEDRPGIAKSHDAATQKTSAESKAPRSVILVDENALEKNKSPLIDASGHTTAVWTELEQLIAQLDAHQRKTENFCARLDALGLLEKFDADFHPKPPAGSSTPPEAFAPKRINGLLRVKRSALVALGDEAAAALLRDGSITRIEAHLNSFNRFDRLMDLYALASTAAH